MTQITAPPRGPDDAARGCGPLLDERQTGVHAGPGAEVVPDLDRPAVPRQEHRAAVLAAQPDAQRRGRAHRHVELLLTRRVGRVHHDQRRGVELRHEPPLEHLAVARHGRPVDARGRRAVAVLAQPVDLELRRGGVEPPPRQARLRAEPGGRARAGTAAAGRGDRLDARQDQHLVASPRSRRSAEYSRSGSRITSSSGSSTRRPRREKRTLMRSRRDQRPAMGTGQPSSGSSSSPPGGGSTPLLTSTRSG